MIFSISAVVDDLYGGCFRTDSEEKKKEEKKNINIYSKQGITDLWYATSG